MREDSLKSRPESPKREARIEDQRLQNFRATFFEQLLESLEDPVFVKNDKHQWIYANSSLEELLGDNDLIGKTDRDFLPADQVETFYEGDRYVIEEQKSLVREEQIGIDCYALVKKMPITLPDGTQGLVGIIFDITEYRKSQQEVSKLKLAKQLSLTDPLTMLANRRHLEEFFSTRDIETTGEDSSTGLLHIDLDHFKEINDTKGHAHGDAVLVYLADALRTSTKNDDFVARIGGDEFVIVSQHSTQTELERLAMRIISKIDEPHVIANESCRLSVSIGITTGITNESLNKMLKSADIALYQAKSNGRGRYEFFTPKLLQEHERLRKRRDEFHRAIDTGQFFPVYQPQFDTVTGKIVGIEALARWNHQTQGILPPSEFLDLAASERRLVELDSQILTKAVRDINESIATGYQLPRLSVNVSTETIEREDLVDRIRDLMPVSSGLCLELVESMLLDEPTGIILNNLTELRELGVSLDIDDFGSGHASLLGLLEAQPDRVKIDKRLVIPMVESRRHRDLVRSIIHIAQSMGIETIAEGVESEAHRQILEDLGCRSIQGFGFARPMLLEELQKLHLQRAA